MHSKAERQFTTAFSLEYDLDHMMTGIEGHSRRMGNFITKINLNMNYLQLIEY